MATENTTPKSYSEIRDMMYNLEEEFEKSCKAAGEAVREGKDGAWDEEFMLGDTLNSMTIIFQHMLAMNYKYAEKSVYRNGLDIAKDLEKYTYLSTDGMLK